MKRGEIMAEEIKEEVVDTEATPDEPVETVVEPVAETPTEEPSDIPDVTPEPSMLEVMDLLKAIQQSIESLATPTIQTADTVEEETDLSEEMDVIGADSEQGEPVDEDTEEITELLDL
ncbi:hypothetical protein H3T72_gp27 [Enterococcus phage vB_EfaP_Ef7.3]|uniref:Uncharacterized protein n=1 Tax=Enterococcus phage vB_EfaP_Ef7.3 TaxID=2546619 RepID=A0A4D6DSG6_9CAUD|nr:hypothetical protein H3T72_gp27 [Enterococcus phage vB_EfaP_Ef7.3]QBZ69078.1 hypothetical protein [Enterococcus phage vB_EfaP_Ef7.3]